MKTHYTFLALVLATSTAFAADKIDPRLVTVRKVFVVPVDELGDDRVVATCLPNRLATRTAVAAVATNDEADAILEVTRSSIGAHPMSHMIVRLADGTVLWETRTPRRGWGVNVFQIDFGCRLAGELADNLRDAMRKARDKK